MSRSKPFDLVVHMFAPVWESAEQYRGQTYPRSTRDLREAKDFLAINPDIFEHVEQFSTHAKLYLLDDFWRELRHPFWAFARNYTRYSLVKDKREKSMYCSKCFSEHKPNEQCRVVKPASEEVIREALEAIRGLGEKWKA